MRRGSLIRLALLSRYASLPSFLVCATALAAEPSPTGAETTPSAVVLSEMTVTARPEPSEIGYTVPNATTATKTDTPIMETPLSIQVVPQQVLKDQHIVQLRDALRNVSGVQHAGFSYDGLYDVFTIRGFRTGNYGIAYRDGFRLRTPHFNVANIERVEVLKGASAGLYGRIEPGGLVNVVIKKPLAEPYYSIEQQAGQFDFYRTILDATGPLNADKSLLYRGVFSYQNAGSFRDEKEDERILVSPSLTWNLSPQTQVHLNFEYEHTEEFLDSGLAALGARPAPVSIDRYLGVLGLPLSPTDYYIADTHFSHQFNDDWSVKLRGAWWRRDATYFEAAPLAGVNPDGRTVDLYLSTFYEQDDDIYLGELNLTGALEGFGLKHDLLLAGEYYYVKSDQFSFFDTAPNLPLRPLDIFDPDFQQFSSFRQARNSFFNPSDEWYAFTVQDLVRVTDRLNLLASGRYDDVRQSVESCGSPTPSCPPGSKRTTDYDSFMPRVGVSYQIQSWLAVFGSYSESFGASTLGILPDGSLSDPEEGKQYEIGLKGEWLDGQVSANLALFHLTKRNVAAPIPGRPGFVDQIGKARSQGIELDVSGRITEGWNLIASYAFLDAEINEDRDAAGGVRNAGNTLPNAPTHSGSLWSQYELPHGFGFGAGLFAASQRQGDAPNTFQLPGYVRVDAAASYKFNFGGSRLTAQLNVHNLLDKEYYDGTGGGFGTEEARNFIYPGAPRTVVGSLRVEF